MKNNDLTSDFFVNDCNKALEIDCNYLEALISKGQALVTAGQLEEALNIYNKALEIDCNCLEALCEKGQTLIKLERLEELVEVYDKMIEMFPEKSEEACFAKIKLLLTINAIKDVEGDKNHESDEEYESDELSVLGFSEDYSDSE